MAEPRRDSTSSLQRKKPPWLKLDIPTAQMSLDEPPTFVQPVKRQGFLRSISMPVETSHLPSPPRDLFDPRRAPLQRQSSITQTIKSSKRVHFERIHTVPIKGPRAARRSSRSSRRHHSLSRTLLRYTSRSKGTVADRKVSGIQERLLAKAPGHTGQTVSQVDTLPLFHYSLISSHSRTPLVTPSAPGSSGVSHGLV